MKIHAITRPQSGWKDQKLDSQPISYSHIPHKISQYFPSKELLTNSPSMWNHLSGQELTLLTFLICLGLLLLCVCVCVSCIYVRYIHTNVCQCTCPCVHRWKPKKDILYLELWLYTFCEDRVHHWNWSSVLWLHGWPLSYQDPLVFTLISAGVTCMYTATPSFKNTYSLVISCMYTMYLDHMNPNSLSHSPLQSIQHIPLQLGYLVCHLILLYFFLNKWLSLSGVVSMYMDMIIYWNTRLSL